MSWRPEPEDAPRLGVMTLLHARHAYIRAIAASIRQMCLPVEWQIVLNRPTSKVVAELNAALARLHPSVRPTLLDAPFSPLDKVERFMELRQWQLERLSPCDYAALWDDDHVLGDPKAVRATLLENPDLVYATKTFFWDNDASVNTRLPPHRSAFFFRYLAGDAFPLDRTIHAPARVHDTAKIVVDLPGGLLDYGYMTLEDRERCWRDYKRVGKIDAATLPLIQPPVLAGWPGPYPLRRDPDDEPIE